MFGSETRFVERLDPVGLVRPPEPHVEHLLHAEPLAELLAEEVRVAAAGETASSATHPAVRWSEWL